LQDSTQATESLFGITATKSKNILSPNLLDTM
jgi:hypothetical protein